MYQAVCSNISDWAPIEDSPAAPSIIPIYQSGAGENGPRGPKNSQRRPAEIGLFWENSRWARRIAEDCRGMEYRNNYR